MPTTDHRRLTRRTVDRIQAGALAALVCAALIGLRFAGEVAAYCCLVVLVAVGVIFAVEYRSEP